MGKSKYFIKKFNPNLKCAKVNNNISKFYKNCENLMQKRTKNVKRAKTISKNINNRWYWLFLGGAIIGFLNGFFGGGGGMVCVPILQKVLGLDAKKSHATAIAVIFPLSLISAFIYVINGYIQSLPLLFVGSGVVIGGLIGALFLKILPPKVVRIIFAIIMFLGGIKLIL